MYRLPTLITTTTGLWNLRPNPTTIQILRLRLGRCCVQIPLVEACSINTEKWRVVEGGQAANAGGEDGEV